MKFKDYPTFQPDFTPRQMFQMGVFGGTYYRPIYSTVARRKYTTAWKEFDKTFSGIPDNKYRSEKCDKSVNYYNAVSGSSLEQWESKGWIHKQDPYGWVQWFMRFVAGRRTPDDARQIKRWLGIKNRFVPMAKRHPGSNKLKQLLLQWSIKI